MIREDLHGAPVPSLIQDAQSERCCTSTIIGASGPDDPIPSRLGRRYVSVHVHPKQILSIAQRGLLALVLVQYSGMGQALFVTKEIWQESPVVNELNIINVVFKTDTTLASGATIVITGLTGMHQNK